MKIPVVTITFKLRDCPRQKSIFWQQIHLLNYALLTRLHIYTLEWTFPGSPIHVHECGHVRRSITVCVCVCTCFRDAKTERKGKDLLLCSLPYCYTRPTWTHAFIDSGQAQASSESSTHRGRPLRNRPHMWVVVGGCLIVFGNICANTTLTETEFHLFWPLHIREL